MTTSRGTRSRSARVLAWAVTLLLFLRFSSSSALIGANLSPPTLVTVGSVLEAYEVLLPFVLIPVFFVFQGTRAPPVPFRTTLAALGLLGAALVVWLSLLLMGPVLAVLDAFLVLSIAAVVGCALMAHSFLAARRDSMRSWSRVVVGALFAVVPVVFAMRLAALEGLDPVTGSGVALRGNWFFVHLPTIALEFLVLAVYLNVVLDRTPSELRKKWYAFLPFLLVPLAMDAVTDRPLTGYVLSALVSWGSNLALFSPAIYSLGLLTAVFAAFVSALLLLGRHGKEESWDLLLLGCASTFFAGFYPSMASVAGLGVGMLLVALAVDSWPRRHPEAATTKPSATEKTPRSPLPSEAELPHDDG